MKCREKRKAGHDTSQRTKKNKRVEKIEEEKRIFGKYREKRKARHDTYLTTKKKNKRAEEIEEER